MKIFLSLLLLFSSNAFAKRYIKYEDDPNMRIDTTKNFSDTVMVTWVQAKDVTKTCDKESRKRGLDGFNYEVEACSFWGKRMGVRVCYVITEKNPTLITLGHEYLHCAQGDWHENFK